jgi:hypothetical protein
MASVEGSNEVEFPDRGTSLRADHGGHARRIDLVHLVCQVDLVGSVLLVYALSLVQPNKRDRRDRPDRPDNSIPMLAD